MSNYSHESEHDRALRDLIHESLSAPPLSPSSELRAEIEQRLEESEAMKVTLPEKESKSVGKKPSILRHWPTAALLVIICFLLVGLFLPAVQMARQSARNVDLSGGYKISPESWSYESDPALQPSSAMRPEDMMKLQKGPISASTPESSGDAATVEDIQIANAATVPVEADAYSGFPKHWAKEIGGIRGTGVQGRAVRLEAQGGASLQGKANLTADESKQLADLQQGVFYFSYDRLNPQFGGYDAGGEQYDPIYDNPFLPVKDAPLSTFSIDVDTASYANIRRFLNQGQLPPKNAVRIEELLNYFSYEYPEPKGEDPFSVNMETAPCPWQPNHLLLRVGLKGKDVHRAERPASNLVFLVDVSGSMADENKLPLLKQSLTMLTRELGERDKVTIVTYAGEAGLRMEPTPGSNKEKITAIINSLSSGGSTHGSAGIQLAYEQARGAFLKEGTNRVILCTDGDLNVGITSDDALVDLIAREAKSGVFLTVLGFGTGNLKDSKMEKLADHGNGMYAYIDSVREARKVLVEQMSGSLVTIAKDVKLQIEFNPAQVRSYRLIGYENRVLAAKDFNDDTKDAGEIGAGHTVTALYELVPADAPQPRSAVDELKYQGRGQGTGDRGQEEKAAEQGGRGAGEKEVSKELLTLKLRYKQPDQDVSKKLEYPLAERGTRFAQATSDFRFAASVAAFGMILRDSPYRGDVTLAGVAEIAASSLGKDPQGYRAEFLDLVRQAERLGK